MKSTVLGKTGLVVSRIGFGGIPIQRVSEEEAVQVVLRCVQLGVTFLDTANAYSNSEERIGKALAALPGQREQLVIATKTMARDRTTAWQHLEQSRRDLGIDVVDLWQLHNVSSMDAYEQVLAPGGALEAMQEALETGRVRHVGVSSHSMDVALEAVASGLFETLQFPFNFVTDEPADKLLPLIREHGLGFIAMKPLGGGLLSDAKLCIKYLLQFDEVVPDPGIERVEEIEEIAAIVSVSWELTPAEWEDLARIREEVGVRFCRRCGYCEPCSQGVRISVLMNLRNIWKRMPSERLVTGWVGEAVKSAGDCIECGECEEKCPYQLPIRELIVENIRFYEKALLEVPSAQSKEAVGS